MDASEAVAAMKAIPGRTVAFSVTKEQNGEGEQTVEGEQTPKWEHAFYSLSATCSLQAEYTASRGCCGERILSGADSTLK